MPLQVLYQGVSKQRAAMLFRKLPVLSHGPRERFYRGRFQRQPVSRLRSCRSWRALDHIQTVHIRTAVRQIHHRSRNLGPLGIAALGEVADVADISRKTRIQKVSVERDDYVGLFKIVTRLDRLA